MIKTLINNHINRDTRREDTHLNTQRPERTYIHNDTLRQCILARNTLIAATIAQVHKQKCTLYVHCIHRWKQYKQQWKTKNNSGFYEAANYDIKYKDSSISTLVHRLYFHCRHHLDHYRLAPTPQIPYSAPVQVVDHRFYNSQLHQ